MSLETERIGPPTAGATHSHGGGGALTANDNIPDHTAQQVADALEDHLYVPGNHTHALLLEPAATLSFSVDAFSSSINPNMYGTLDDDSDAGPISHEPAAGSLGHTPHTHSTDIGGSSAYSSHTHGVVKHAHDAHLATTAHIHTGGQHSHEYHMNPSIEHKHTITDAEHTHTGDFIDVHTHAIAAVVPDTGHTHSITISGLMLMPIENISASATPGQSGMGNLTPYTCSDSEDRRNFNRRADSTDGLPAGIVLLWSRPTSSIPDGWGLADGSGNSTGSGWNLVDWLIVHTGSDAENYSVWKIDPPPDGMHEHDVILVPHTFTTELGTAATGIGTSGSAGLHTHNGTLEGDGGSHFHDGGHHLHPGIVVPEAVKTSTSGLHSDHSLTSLTRTVPGVHLCSDVVALVADHPDHTHHVNNTRDVDDGGSINVVASKGRTEGVNKNSPDNVLGHVHAPLGANLDHGSSHNHSISLVAAGVHFHRAADHSHPIEVFGDGAHTHSGGYHSHPVRDHFNGTHSHTMSDPMHTHPIDIDIHTHVAVADDGRHIHPESLPKRTYLIPIEKLP